MDNHTHTHTNLSLRVKNHKKGFTLIELLVVIAVIGLIASIILVGVNQARVKARDVRRLADLHQISIALELFMDDNNIYPGNPATWYWIHDNNYPGAGPWPPCDTTTGGLKPYLPNVCLLKDPQGYGYAYRVIDVYSSYQLGARFELSQNQGAKFLKPGDIWLTGYYQPK